MADTERLHALDAVRALALLSGIVLHAAWSFLPGLDRAVFPLADRSSSVVLAVTFYTIHSFRMPVFFLLGGFFARRLLDQRGLREFIANRQRRVLQPLVFGWIVLYPWIWIAFTWARMADQPGYQPTLPAVFTRGLNIPLAHLWFLYYLLLFYTGAVAARWVATRLLDRRGTVRVRVDRLVAGLADGPWIPVLVSAPLSLALFSRAEWFAWFGVSAPDTSLQPVLSPTLVYGTAFGLGWLVHRQPALLHACRRKAGRSLIAASLITTVNLMWIGAAPDHTPAVQSAATLLYAMSYMVASWCWTFAAIGIAVARCSAPSRLQRYLADASFWVYLVHLPVIFLLQAALRDSAWHWTLKFSGIVAATAGLCFGSYHLLVRSTRVGALLDARPLEAR